MSRIDLGTVVNIRTGKLDANACCENGKFPFFTCSREPLRIDSYTYDCECILVAGNGDLNVKYYNGKFDAYQRTYIIEAKDNNSLLVRYLYYFIDSKMGFIRSQSIGGVIKYIKLGDLTSLMLPIPTFNRQQEIAAILDKASELVEKRKAQLAELDTLAESIFYDMFGDPVTNEKGWETRSFNELGKITTGNTPSRQVDSYYNEDYIEWIKTDNIVNGVIYPTKAKECLSREGLGVGRSVKANSLLITCIAGSIKSIGTVCLSDRVVAFNQQINAFTPNIDICNCLFMWCLIRFSKKYIQDSATNGMKRIITKSVMEKLLFICPSLPLQQQFAERIEKIEAQKQKVKAALKESEDLFQRLMQDLFKPM